ncbi:hypothetical protein PR202_gb27359 [Eleusine coracana subsp. coracana]|uniref:Uncharacterized protein n=1 Tax=Eleusine coracana subsp. coracana TaxID=191504 RepID=A0AAV5FU22_ELECO|nr:hypothetical protein PR202_gb27359 [Eleusine coracana subsp. coracana]
MINGTLACSGLPKDMQVEELDVYNVSSANSMATDGCEASDLLDNSDDSSLRVHDDASSHACSSESSVNNKDIDRNLNTKPFFVRTNEENESVIDKDFQSIFLNSSDGPTCRLLEKSLLPLRLNPATEISNDCFDSYWRYKSAPNSFYEDAEKMSKIGSSFKSAGDGSPVATNTGREVVDFVCYCYSQLDTYIDSLLLLGDKLKDALNELQSTCNSSSTALPFR